MPTTKLLIKDGFTFNLESMSNGLTRVLSVHGRMVEKKNKVAKTEIPEPSSGVIGQGSTLYSLGVDRGHLVAQHVGGPNIKENIVPMYSYFNRIGPWRAAELELRSDLANNPFLAIEITYDSSKPTLPVRFKYDASSAPITTAANGKEVPMQLRSAEPYNATNHELNKTETAYYVAQFEKYVKPVLANAKDPRNPYLILDEVNAQHKIFRVDAQEKFQKGQRIWIKILNSLYSQNGHLTSDADADPYKILNCFGGWDFPQIDHDIPCSRGGSNHFANARVVSYKYNSDKRDQVSLDLSVALQTQADDYRKTRLRSTASRTDQKVADREKTRQDQLLKKIAVREKRWKTNRSAATNASRQT